MILMRRRIGPPYGRGMGQHVPAGPFLERAVQGHRGRARQVRGGDGARGGARQGKVGGGAEKEADGKK